jgi:hypothetical protein
MLLRVSARGRKRTFLSLYRMLSNNALELTLDR